MNPQSKTVRFTMFALLYFTQGTILGYFASLNALYMLDNGLDMADVGIFSTIALIPFIIKILFGILSDRVNLLGLGHRKPYIFIGLLVQFACLIAVANINPGKSYWLYVAIAFLLQLGMAFYDTCTDGLALDITPESEKGTLQGFMVGGRSVGVIVAASVAGVIAQHLSWPAVFYFLAALTLIPIPFLFFIRELQRAPEMRFNWKAFNAFKNVKVLAVAAVGLIVFLVIVGGNQIVNPSFDARLGIDLSTAGLITTVWGIGCIAGALAGGRVMDKLGNQKALWLSILLVIPAMGLLAATSSKPMMWAVAVFFGVAYGLSQAIYFALAMKYTQPAIAASMYSILMAVTNVGQGIGLGLSGGLAKSAGYPVTFLVFGALMLLVIPFLPSYSESELRDKRLPMKRIYITHCSREKDPALEASGEAATPEKLYTSPALQAFIQFCKAHGHDWAILSDRYGVVFPEEKITWYSKPPDTVTEEELLALLRSFTTRLAEFDEILFQHRPGETHAVFKRIIEKAQELGMKVKEFTVEDMNTNG